MRLFRILGWITALLALPCVQGNAVPAYPKPKTYVQPDGTTVTYHLRGDERQHWMETTDGYMLQRSADGYLCYARRGEAGLEAADVYRGGQVTSQLKTSTRRLRRQDVTAADLRTDTDPVVTPGLGTRGTFPLEGKHRLLMLLVNFNGTQTTFQPDEFAALMNGDNYNGTGSFRDYYLKSSYGKLDIETTVVGWIQLPGTKTYYGTGDMTQLISDAIALLGDDINLADFDNDGDGELDGLSIIHQGRGAEESGNGADIWSHSAEVTGVERDGVRVRKYTIQPEQGAADGPLAEPIMTTIGVLCHEFGHNLGAPDFYDTDYEANGEYSGTGDWDLMASGIWHEYLEPGDSPAGINMWQKIQFGWVDPVTLTADCTVSDLSAAVDKPVGYVLPTMRPGDYFVLENRQQKDIDRMLPGHGLIVYHVDENRLAGTMPMNAINADASQSVYTVCASAGCDPAGTPLSYGDINSAGAAFPGTSQRTSLTDLTLPSLHSNDRKYAYRALTDIAETADGLVSFRFTLGDTPATVDNFTAQARQGIVTLTWDAPATNAEVSRYRIFRDDEPLAETAECAYVDEELDKTQAEYKVDVEYADGQFSPFVYAQVKVPVNRVSKLASASADGIVTLTWDLQNELSRSQNDSENLNNAIYQYIESEEADIAHRFNAHDLTVYVGHAIGSIGFIPFTSQRISTYAVRVWRTASGSGQWQIVSETPVTEYASGQWRDVTLADPVTIEAGYDYQVGVHGTAQFADFTFICDGETPANGLGNLSMTSDGEWRTDVLDYNPFIRARLTAPEDYGEFVPNESPVFLPAFDPATDTDYPIGFSVYRNGERIGFTSSLTFQDRVPQSGVYKYGVACLYEGNNEAKATERSLYAIAQPPATGLEEGVQAAAQVEGGRGEIRIGTPAGMTVAVYTLSGTQVAAREVAAGETAIAVPEAGVYIVRLVGNPDTRTVKVYVE